MRKTSWWIVIACCAFGVALLAVAQAGRKPGLWEVTSKMTWQQSPFPAGMTGPAGASTMNAAPHATQVCLTQAMIDKYGGPMPQTHNNDCQVSNINRTASGMTADWTCSGQMSGKGTIESSWTDDNHTAGKIHFVGTMQTRQGVGKTVEWTNESTSVYKGPDCGSVKPIDENKPAK